MKRLVLALFVAGGLCDSYSDYVKNPQSRGYGQHTSCLSVQDSILGLRFETPEATCGWTFSGKAEFDLAGDHANDYAFHWRHLFVEAKLVVEYAR